MLNDGRSQHASLLVDLLFVLSMQMHVKHILLLYWIELTLLQHVSNFRFK